MLDLDLYKLPLKKFRTLNNSSKLMDMKNLLELNFLSIKLTKNSLIIMKDMNLKKFN